MRISSAVASAFLSAAILVGHVRADELDDLASDVPSAASSSSTTSSTSSVQRPTFTPTNLKAPFLEQFTDDWDSRWSPSHAKKAQDKNSESSGEEWAYVGEWAVEEPTVLKGIDGDKGLVVKNPAAHHAISAKFPKVIDNKGKTLVVQYEVKLQNGLECGGAYLKLLQDNKALHAEEFSNASPYVIMFGPDKCGVTNKVHFIFRHKNPKTGEYEEKHLVAPPPARLVKTTTLYTLIVKPDQSYQIRIDGAAIKNGTLLDDFSPAVNPPKEIDDTDDKKPADWVDEARIPDPKAKKPADWDEDAPYEVLDEDAKKPDDWLENEPKVIPDPEAEKPEHWDDEEDGDWVPPTVPNPKCEEAAGCGEWNRPMKKNPAYKGKWSAPLIDNPAYKGVWKPRKIPNPNYFEDKTPSNFEPMGAIGFEIWTMQNNILFDNIYIGHSVEDAERFKAETFDVKHAVEKQEDQASKPKNAADDDDSASRKTPKEGFAAFRARPLGFVRDRLDLFFALARNDPVRAARFMPEVAVGLGAVALTVIATLVGIVALGGGAASASSRASAAVPPQAKQAAEMAADKAREVAGKVADAAADAKDRVVDATASGVEKVEAEVQKRTGRNSAQE